MESVVRMGEAAASSAAGDILACIGLGSCIGLTLVDRLAGIAALAHIMLPTSSGRAGAEIPQPNKFADLAVPALVDLAVDAGASRTRLEAALVGGAAMFQFGGGGQDIGARTEAAVSSLLVRLRIPIRATATGGAKGRTVRVHVGPAISITVRVAGGRDEDLLGTSAMAVAA
jgi:chemotaxis protein CheD